LTDSTLSAFAHAPDEKLVSKLDFLLPTHECKLMVIHDLDYRRSQCLSNSPGKTLWGKIAQKNNQQQYI